MGISARAGYMTVTNGKAASCVATIFDRGGTADLRLTKRNYIIINS